MAKFKPKANLVKSQDAINSASFVRKLYQQGEHILKAAKLALKVGVDGVVSDAKANVPVNSGALKESIAATPFGVGNAKGTGYLVTAGAIGRNGVNYAPYVEFDPRINKPYMYPALKKNRSNIYKLIRTAIEGASYGNG